MSVGTALLRKYVVRMRNVHLQCLCCCTSLAQCIHIHFEEHFMYHFTYLSLVEIRVTALCSLHAELFTVKGLEQKNAFRIQFYITLGTCMIISIYPLTN